MISRLPQGVEAVGAALVLVAVAALGAAMLIVALRPLLLRYALARPNARSGHSVPTPQGGGIAVLAAALVTAGAGGLWLGLGAGPWWRLGLVVGAAVLMAGVGLVDDIVPLPPLPRLGLQLAGVAIAVVALPAEVRVLPGLPLGLERAILVLGGGWFVNLTNFMDGMDLMTVAEFAPVTAALTLFWHWGFLSAPAGLAALGLCGALLGFAPFNKPAARLFLGDVGSLPIGLIVAYCLFDLAGHGGLAAAILLVLYYIADATITLVWRLQRGDRIWEAHRLHYYQVAQSRGFSVQDVLVRVFAVNLALALFATASLLQTSAALVWLDLGLGGLVVFRLLRDLGRGRGADRML